MNFTIKVNELQNSYGDMPQRGDGVFQNDIRDGHCGTQM